MTELGIGIRSKDSKFDMKFDMKFGIAGDGRGCQWEVDGGGVEECEDEDADGVRLERR